MKIAIIGVGIAGPTLAHWLLRGGHQPTLIEKSPALRTGGYIIDFWGLGYTVAERMGILPQVRAAGYSVQEVRLVNKRGRKVGGFSANVFRRMINDRFTSVPRGDLAAIIYRNIENRAETIFGDTISAIEEDNCGVTVSFERGGPRNFDLLIGADGLHSTVRELLFGPQSQFEKSLGYWVAAFQVRGYRPRDELVYLSHASAGREIARFSLRDDRTMFLFIFVNQRMTSPEPRDGNERKAILRQVFADVGWECPQILRAMDQVDDIYFDRVSQIRMDCWSKGRTMLIGDAASCASLLAGEGTGLAMAQAYVLAGELKRAGNDYRQAYGCHEQRLRPFIERKQDSARRFASAFAPKTWMGVHLRNQVSKLLTVPPIAEFFLARDLQDRLELPDYQM